jgi:hypothetical protein
MFRSELLTLTALLGALLLRCRGEAN